MTPPPRDDHWTDRAACRDHPAGWFTDPSSRAQTRAALDICHRCPVRTACLHTALTRDPDADIGIWGGTTRRQRDQLRAGRHHAPAAPATPKARTPSQPRSPRRRSYPTPRATVARDPHGDFTDTTGRILITRLPTTGSPRQRDYLLLIDGHPTARVDRLADAQAIAWQHLHRHPPTRPRPSGKRTPVTRAISR